MRGGQAFGFMAEWQSGTLAWKGYCHFSNIEF